MELDKPLSQRPAYDVLVVSPNSALDSYYVLSELCVGSVNRAERSFHTAGGKGNNMARAVKRLGGKALSLGILGGHSGRFVAAELEREQISCDVVWVDTETRRSSTILVPGYRQTTVALDSGAPVCMEDGLALMDKVYKRSKEAPYMVFTGSLPPGLDANFYAGCITRLASQGSPATCIDCSGEVLQLAAQTGPTIIKVNLDEFQAAYAANQAWDWKNAIDIFGKLQDHGVELLIITAGPAGAYVFHKNIAPYNVATQTQRILTTAGAGDTFMAGLVLALNRGETIEQATCFGSAAAAANLMHIVCGDLELADVEELLSHTCLTPLA